MFLISGLIAASVVDFEQFIIPVQIPWLTAIIGITVHAIIDHPALPCALNANPSIAALGAGGGVGLLLSIVLWAKGFIPTSFAEGEPLLDVRSRGARCRAGTGEAPRP